MGDREQSREVVDSPRMPLWTDVFVIVIQIIRALDAMFFAYYVSKPVGRCIQRDPP